VSVRVNECVLQDPGYKPSAKPDADPAPSGFFDKMAALEDEGKTVLQIHYRDELRVLDPSPPPEWREWRYPQAKAAWDRAGG
jgi:hypothetical protein